VTSQLPWPDTLLRVRWPALRSLYDRCLKLAESDALPGTIMLVGEPGLGREAFAITLAAGLVCRERGGLDCACSSCERVRRGVHPDVEVVAVLPEKRLISIDQARGIVDHVAQHPYEGRRRVIVVASSHTPPLGADAAAALLKTLEEPPGHVIFLLLASSPARVLPTIVSRSVQVRIPPPSDEDVLALIEGVQACGREDAVRWLAECAGEAGLAVQGTLEPDAEHAAAERDLFAAAALGNGLAALRAARSAASEPAGVARAVALLLLHARMVPPGIGERVLDAAAALINAEHRSHVLNLDLEPTVVGALACVAFPQKSI
jgi:DNA polymerase III delta prime subunit